MERIISKIQTDLSWSLEYKDESHLKAYLLGFTRTEKELFEYISNYLGYKYDINTVFNNVFEQIDTYSFIKKENWFTGFVLLLSEIKENLEKMPFEQNKPNVIQVIELTEIDEI